MTHDEFVRTLKTRFCLDTTRRTVWQYERWGLIPEPEWATGKAKEYYDSSVADFVASWGLVHGEFAVKPAKVAEIRRRAWNLIADFPAFWQDSPEIGACCNSAYSFANEYLSAEKPTSRVLDPFLHAWLMLYYGTRIGTLKTITAVKDFLESGDYANLPKVDIEQEHHIQNVTTAHSQLRVRPMGFLTSGFEETTMDAASGHGRITLNLHTFGKDAFDIGPEKVLIFRHWLDIEER